MPAGRVYRKKKNPRKRYKKKYNPNKYRRAVARVARPLNVKPRSAFQNVTYYNSFLCRPTLDTSQTAGEKQQNWSFTMNLNSLWPFRTDYNAHSTANSQVFTPNEAITGYTEPVTDAMTTMPNIRDGANLFTQYSQAVVCGTKVTLVATPIGNSTNNQMGYLYSVTHSQPSSGLNNRSTINEVNKLPYRKYSKIMGPDAPTSGFQSGKKVGAKLVIKHSPRKFNNVKDLRDNQNLFCSTGSNSVAHGPAESDFLTIGVIPALNGLDTQVTDFCLQIKVEQRLLWTEPLENLSSGSGNYSFPWRAVLSSGAVTAAGMYF